MNLPLLPPFHQSHATVEALTMPSLFSPRHLSLPSWKELHRRATSSLYLQGKRIMPPKYNEVLLGVKTNKSGEIICAKYNTRERTYFEGVHAHPTKVKFIPLKEAPKHATIASETPRKHHKTMVDLEKELVEQHTIIALLEAYQCV